MTITIYVSEKYLENLYKFLSDGLERPIEWHNQRPGSLTERFFKVNISYNDFVNLEELSE